MGPGDHHGLRAELVRAQVMDAEQGALLTQPAGYRNRLVRFYDEGSARELYEICSGQTDDVRSILEALLTWARRHPDRIDGAL